MAWLPFQKDNQFSNQINIFFQDCERFKLWRSFCQKQTALNNRNVDGSKFKKKHIEQVIQNLRIKQQARMKIRFVKLGIVSFHILSHNHP